MKLTYFTVSNYRSITTAYKIDLQNITVLIGKNNEGKSNLIRALKLAMDILNFIGIMKRKVISHQFYSWREDFPISLQNKKKMQNKDTEFRLDFQLDPAEIELFYISVGSNINGSLSIFIKIKQDESISVTVPKSGKNATSLTQKIEKISNFICENISIQYIPAIRSESDAYEVISSIVETELSQTDDNEYKKAQAYIAEYQTKRLHDLSEKIKVPLSVFMPDIKKVNLTISDRFANRRTFMSGKQIGVEIDDGVLTSLAQKGDGVKSLTTMAILSQTNATNRIIIVDEPENHLHPEAIHYLKKVLYDLAEKNQIVISSHNPIFVNRMDVTSNVIVEKGKVTPARRVDEIRKTLGVKTSDNLMYSDYVIVVEGPSDKVIIEQLIQQSDMAMALLSSNTISVRPIGGVNNLQSELYNLDRYLCNYLVILDNDTAAKNAVAEAQRKLNIPNQHFRYLCLPNYVENELEDLYNEDAYREKFKSDYQLDISVGIFKNKSKKWSRRITEIAKMTGQILIDSQVNMFKETLSDSAKTCPFEAFYTDEARLLLHTLLEKIDGDIISLSL